MIFGFCFSPFIDNWDRRKVCALSGPVASRIACVSVDLVGLCKAGA